MQLFTTTLGETLLAKAAFAPNGQLGPVIVHLFDNAVPLSRSARPGLFLDPPFLGYSPVELRVPPTVDVDGNGNGRLTWPGASYTPSAGRQQVDTLGIESGPGVCAYISLAQYAVQFGGRYSVTRFCECPVGGAEDFARNITACLNADSQWSKYFTAQWSLATVIITHDEPANNDPSFVLYASWDNVVFPKSAQSFPRVAGLAAPPVFAAVNGIYLIDKGSGVLIGYGYFDEHLLITTPGQSVPTGTFSISWGG